MAGTPDLCYDKDNTQFNPFVSKGYRAAIPYASPHSTLG